MSNAGLPQLPGMSEPMVEMFSPEGVKGKIPHAKIHDALDHGFEPAIPVTSPEGQAGWVPFKKMRDAQGAGFQVRGITKERTVPPPVPPAELSGGGSHLNPFTGILSPRLLGHLPAPAEYYQGVEVTRGTHNVAEVIQRYRRMEQIATAAGNPDLAREMNYRAGTLEALVGQVSGYASPAAVGVIAAGPLTKKAVELGKISRATGTALGAAPGIAFGTKGLIDSFRPKGKNETLPDYVERVMNGAAQVLFATAGVAEARRGGALAKTATTRIEPEQFLNRIGYAMKDHFVERIDDALSREVDKHANAVEKVVDDPQRNPVPAIDARPVIERMKQVHDSIVQDLQSGRPTLPSVYAKLIEDSLAKPRWTFAEAKQIRTALNEVTFKSGDPKIRAIGAAVGTEIRGQMETAAKAQGMEDSFKQYNDVFSKQSKLRKQVINKIGKAISGESVVKTLAANKGYLLDLLPSLSPYGADIEAITEAVKIAESKGGARSRWNNWMIRYLGGEAASRMGMPFFLGYIVAGEGGQRLRGMIEKSAIEPEAKSYSSGKALMEKTLPPPPKPLSEPKAIPAPEKPPTRSLPPGPQGPPPGPKFVMTPEGWRKAGASSVPPVHSPASTPASATGSASRAPSETPEAAVSAGPPPPPRTTDELEIEIGRRRMWQEAINRLQGKVRDRGLKGLSRAWIEDQTGLDMSDPANIPKAIQKFKDFLKGEEPAASETGRKAKGQTAPQPPAERSSRVIPLKGETSPVGSRPTEPVKPVPSEPVPPTPMTEPEPVRTFRIGRGAHGPVSVVFPDVAHADLYAYKGRFSRSISGKSPVPFESGSARESISKRLGIPASSVAKASYAYREQIHAAIKGLEAGSRFKAPRYTEGVPTRIQEPSVGAVPLIPKADIETPFEPLKRPDITGGKIEPLETPKIDVSVERTKTVRELPAPVIDESEETARNERVSGPTLQGRDTQLRIPEGKLDVHYAVIEASGALTSHNPGNFSPSPNFDPDLQPRAYHLNRDSQMDVIRIAQNLDPGLIVNDNPDAVNGPPILDRDRLVLGGNSRMMAISRAYAEGGGKAYREYLEREAPHFGIKSEDIKKFKQPVLVRILDHPLEKPQAVELAKYLNKSFTKGMSDSEMAVAIGKSLQLETIRSLSSLREALGPDTTLRQLMNQNPHAVISMLERDGIITPQERANFVDQQTGNLTERGKNLVEMAFVGAWIDDPALLEVAPGSSLRRAESVSPELVQLKLGIDEWDITPVIREALREHARFVADSKGRSWDDWLAQGSMFEPERDPMLLTMLKYVVNPDGSLNLQTMKSAFRGFTGDASVAHGVQGKGSFAFYEPPDAVESFNRAFGTDLTLDDYADGIEKAREAEKVRKTAAARP